MSKPRTTNPAGTNSIGELNVETRPYASSSILIIGTAMLRMEKEMREKNTPKPATANLLHIPEPHCLPGAAVPGL